jgi:prepilin-type N-terminal cleavage/methylation domain-containing protein
MKRANTVELFAYHNGFTLLELSIVLIIIAIITGMAMQMSVSVIATARLSATQQKMNIIEAALMQYRTANDRIPCPGDLTLAPGSSNYGIEAANPGICTGGAPSANFTATGVTNSFSASAEGALPAVTLGLSPDFMVDGWGNKFRYAVDANMTAYSAFVNTPVGCIQGAITVNDANGNARSSGSIYALISHGANGHGAYTNNGAIFNAGSTNANEQINCHCDSNGNTTTVSGVQTTNAATYVQMAPTQDSTTTTNNFDDLVSYRERWQMRTDWDKARKCIYMYVVDNSNNRVQKFTKSTGVFINGIGAGYNGVAGTIGSAGAGNGQLAQPIGIAIDSSGNLWVGDDNNGRIEEFDGNGNYLSKFGSGGTGNGQFKLLHGIAIDSRGNFWLADYDNNRVEELNSKGSWLQTIPTGCPDAAMPACASGTGNGQFNSPSGIAVDSSGNIWVGDWGNNRVQKFDIGGNFLMGIGAGYNGVAGAIGSSGTASGQFNGTNGIAIDSSGNVWVADSGNNRVQEFNSSGTYIRQLGCAGTAKCTWNVGATGLPSPQDITFDPYGNVWVTSWGGNRVEEFDSLGNYLNEFPCIGATCANSSANGQFHGPKGIAFSSR